MQVHEVVSAMCLGMGLGAAILWIKGCIKARKKAEASGILQFAFAVKPWYLLCIFSLVLCLYNAGMSLHNRGVYLHRAELVEQHGIEYVLDKAGISEDVLSDGERTAALYIKAQHAKASASVYAALKHFGLFLICLSILGTPVGGYITRDGWCWITRDTIIPVRIQEENGKLLLYLKDSDRALLSLPDTWEERERLALLMAEPEALETNSIS